MVCNYNDYIIYCTIVMRFSLGAGSFSLILSLLLKSSFPSIKIIAGAMILGCFSYGFSIVLFVLALRGLGSARTSALFGTAPFIGTILSFILFNDRISVTFIVALPLMIIGAILLLRENHEHEHRHCHGDGHHEHLHKEEIDDFYV